MPNIRARSSAPCNPILTLLTTSEYAVGPRPLLNIHWNRHVEGRASNRSTKVKVVSAGIRNEYRSALRIAGEVSMGDSGGERTYAGHGTRPARPGRKQEAGFSFCAMDTNGGFSGRPNSSLFEGHGQRTVVPGVPGPESTVGFAQRAILLIALSACSEV